MLASNSDLSAFNFLIAFSWADILTLIFLTSFCRIWFALFHIKLKFKFPDFLIKDDLCFFLFDVKVFFGFFRASVIG